MSCKNCQKVLVPADRFCSNCGAQVVTERFTFRKIFQEFVERYLSFDNKFFVTFKTMFSYPERVVNGYLNGLRVKYVNPITYTVIALTLSGFNVILMRKGYYGELDFAKMTDNQNTPFNMNEYMNLMYDYYSFFVFGILPLIALVSKMVFYNVKHYNFAEHNLIYLYTYSHTTILSMIIIPLYYFFPMDYIYVSYFTFILLFAYHIYALKRIFGLNAKQIVLKTLLFIPIGLIFYFVLSIILVIVFFTYMMATGQLNLESFAR